ncbi:MAG TPA: FTR1 family protein [Chloroflexota bacterium]|nr:FTR1 family protein [Chloroflexota bacterium]
MRLTRVALPLLLAFVLCAPVLADSPQQDLQQADQSVVQARQQLKAGNVDGARQTYQAFRDRWRQIEDGIKDVSSDDYTAIETAMRSVRVALAAEPFDAATADAALDELHETNEHFYESGSATTAAGVEAAQPANGSDAERLRALVGQLDTAHASLSRGDAAAALAAVHTFQRDWPAAEGLVKVKARAVYTLIEDDMESAEALLSGPSPRVYEADAVVTRMRERLAPIAESGTSYGVFDAYIIMLREGLEALLVVGALVAFLKRSGNSGKQPWIWGGAAAGVVLSVALAFGLQQAFSRAEVGFGSELVEGVVGLVAAAMLFYVSYWLHSKARLSTWQKYIHDRGTAALAGGSMLSLGILALLAVFREGAETAVFYLGIAPSISPGDLAVGLGLGVLTLAAIGVAMLTVGVRIPLRPFFLLSSLLIYYLGFKFVGMGLHALQVSGVLPATPAPLPGSEVLGMYPTWETALPQLLLLMAAAVILWFTLREQRRGVASPAATA